MKKHMLLSLKEKTTKGSIILTNQENVRKENSFWHSLPRSLQRDPNYGQREKKQNLSHCKFASTVKNMYKVIVYKNAIILVQLLQSTNSKKYNSPH